MSKTILSRTICLAILFSLFKMSNAQTVTWQWAKNAGLAGSEGVNGSALDASGNLYVTGWFTSPNITFGAVTLTNGGFADIFITKYDAAGNTLWSKNYGGSGGDIGNAVAVDASGNVYVTGQYSSPNMVMGSFTLTNSSSGTNDVFVAKIDPSGNVVWAKSAGGSMHEKAYSIVLDLSGNIFVSGAFESSTINFGTGVLNNASTLDDLFLVKFDQAGTAQWAKSAGGTGADYGSSVATDASGNVYMTGKFSSSAINFGTGALNNASSGSQDIFLVKYSGAGTALWSGRAGGSMDDQGIAITVNGNGVYVAGGFSSALISVGSTTLSNASAGTADLILAKYDTGGNPQWAKSAGGGDFDAANAVSTDGAGNVFITGYFSSNSLLFGASTLTNSSIGYRDVFVASYDALGNSLWATAAPGTSNDTPNSISTNTAGSELYIGGVFDSSPLTFGSTNLYKGCGEDVFVAKLLNPAAGIKEMNAEEIRSVYPNPSNGKFTADAEGTIMLYNVLGQEILREKLEGKKQFDLSAMDKGVYVYKIISKGKPDKTGRIIIQ
jgi:hypothetical protein